MKSIWDNEVLKNALVKEDQFENLGSLKEYCEKFGGVIQIEVDNTEPYNTVLIIKMREEVELKLLCSIPLSKIIFETKLTTEEILDYKVLRVTKDDGSKYIRVSQSIDIKADPNLSIEENIKLTEHVKGSKHLVFYMSDMKPEPIAPKKNNLDDLILL